jgi:hypothetical protein
MDYVKRDNSGKFTASLGLTESKAGHELGKARKEFSFFAANRLENALRNSAAFTRPLS